MENVIPVAILGGAVAAGVTAHKKGWFKNSACEKDGHVQDGNGLCCHSSSYSKELDKCCAPHSATENVCCGFGDEVIDGKCCSNVVEDDKCNEECERPDIDGQCCSSGKIDQLGKCSDEKNYESGLKACLLHRTFKDTPKDKEMTPWHFMKKADTDDESDAAIRSFNKKHCANFDKSLEDESGLKTSSICYTRKGKPKADESSLFVGAPSENTCTLAALSKCKINLENVERIEADVSWNNCAKTAINFLSLVNADKEKNDVLEVLGMCPLGGGVRHGYYSQDDITSDGLV